MLLFAISTDLACFIFTDENDKYVIVFVRIFTILDATEPRFYKSSYRLKNCHTTVSVILCCFR